jgi:hypothetical protein
METFTRWLGLYGFVPVEQPVVQLGMSAWARSGHRNARSFNYLVGQQQERDSRMERPRALASLRLTTSSNLAGD